MTTRKEDIKVSQKKKDECDARAQAIVCELIDGIKTEKEFIEQLRWVNQNHYQDIVEERAISKLCGYPVCKEKLTIMPQKKYHISVSHNKVYDITERKLFCSNQCYKASAYLKMQLHTSPLWLGNREEPEAFSLLTSRTELIGAEVKFEMDSIKVFPSLESEGAPKYNVNHVESESYTSYTLGEDLEFCAEDELEYDVDDDQNEYEFDDENLGSSSQLGENVSKQEFLDTELVENHQKSDSDPDINRTDLSSESTRRIHIDSDESVQGNNGSYAPEKSKSIDTNSTRLKRSGTPRPKTSNECVTRPIYIDSEESVPPGNNGSYAPEKSKSINTNSTKLKRSGTPRPKTSNECVADLIHHIELSMREWITVKSVQFILGEQAVVDMLMSRIRDENYRMKEPKLYALCTSLCERLKIRESDKEGNSIYDLPSSSPVKEAQPLTNKLEEMEMKVKAFYRGDKRVTFDENVKEATIVPDDTRPIGSILPYFHHNQQVPIRRQIVLKKLDLVYGLPVLCDMLALNRVNIASKVKQLVSKCTFEAHNITFKPLEWNLIALIFLRLLAVEDSHIRTSLQDKSKFLIKMLSSYQLEPDYLDLLTSRLTDLDPVLRGRTAS